VKLHWKAPMGGLTFEIEEEEQKPLFRGLAEVQEVFGAETACGLCNSTDIRFRVRKIDENEYFEIRCGHCDAQFGFGQHKNGKTLFPRRQDKDGNYLPNRGWYKWKPKGEYDE